MKEYLIYGDSTCDLDKTVRDAYGIEYFQMNYVLDGKEYPASLDWEELSAREFYDAMRAGKRITTTQVPTESYERVFTECAENGKDVLYVGCSSALSGSINLAKVVAKDVMEKYPKSRIVCIDALNSSFGQGIMLMWASDMRKAGKSIDEAASYIEENRLKVSQCATVGKLDYLRRAGRITASSAFFGNIIGIKPIIISDVIGQNYAIKKVKGAQNAKEEIAAYQAEQIENAADQTIWISHADDEESAAALGELLKAKTGCKDIRLGCIGPIVGASVGPGTIISFCVGKEVTIKGEA
ncbi:MAG: DegV family protein [Lachnospiraceae bacterium]|nr:DegV family protein [Lachnospiraceae bacterium]